MSDPASDQEFSRRVSALNEVLDRHLGPPGPQKIVKTSPLPGFGLPKVLQFPPMDAFYVVGDDPAESLGAINPLVERKNLLKMQQAVRYLAKTIRELHVQTFQQLVDECSALGDLSGESSRDLMPLVRKDPNFWIYFWGAAFVLDEVVDKITPSISDHIETAPVAGRRNLANVTAIESLRDIWEDRKKTPAPMNITDAGPFADFLIEAFEALGLEGNPRAAMDSWREYRAKYPR